jgi:hypothetical protein
MVPSVRVDPRLEGRGVLQFLDKNEVLGARPMFKKAPESRSDHLLGSHARGDLQAVEFGEVGLNEELVHVGRKIISFVRQLYPIGDPYATSGASSAR